MAQFTMNVPDALIPRIAAAARNFLTIMGEDTTGFTDLQVVRRYTKTNWQGLVTSFEGKAAASDFADGVADDFVDVS